MKQLFLVVVLVCLISGTSASTTYAESKSGAAKFTAAGNESINVTMGDKLKLDATYKLVNVGTASAVSVLGNVKNTTNGKLHFAYFVAFMDKDKNIIGCQHFILFVDGGKQSVAGNFIQLPPQQITRIAFYSVAFYESEKPIGSN